MSKQINFIGRFECSDCPIENYLNRAVLSIEDNQFDNAIFNLEKALECILFKKQIPQKIAEGYSRDYLIDDYLRRFHRNSIAGIYEDQGLETSQWDMVWEELDPEFQNKIKENML